MSEFDQVVTNFFKNYHDRGMKKWAGFYLSDHTQTIEKDTKERGKYVLKRPEQSLEEISRVLFNSFSNQYEIDLQLKILNEDGKLVENIVGLVVGYDQESVIINDRRIGLEDISSVEINH